MPVDYSKKQGRPLGSHNFTVEVVKEDGETMALTFGVDECRGLNKGSVAVIKHRTSGTEGYKKLLCGNVDTAPITLVGVYLPDLGDVRKLNKWHDECSGREPVNVDANLRTVIITPSWEKRDYLGKIEAESDTKVSSFVLHGTACVNLTISDFSIKQPDVSEWSVELAFERMEIV